MSILKLITTILMNPNIDIEADKIIFFSGIREIYSYVEQRYLKIINN